MIPGPVVVLILLGALILAAGIVRYWPAAFGDHSTPGEPPHQPSHVRIIHDDDAA